MQPYEYPILALWFAMALTIIYLSRIEDNLYKMLKADHPKYYDKLGRPLGPINHETGILFGYHPRIWTASRFHWRLVFYGVPKELQGNESACRIAQRIRLITIFVLIPGFLLWVIGLPLLVPGR